MYIFVLLGLLLGVPVVWKFREKAGTGKGGAVLLCVLYSVCSVIAAMLFAHLESLISSGEGANGGAISTYGIYFFGSLMMFGIAKGMKWKTAGVMDLYALYAMPSFFMLRINCLRAGCCGGLPMFDTGLNWPTRETELIFYAVMFVIFLQLLRKDKRQGQLFPILMVSYGCFRFVNQWFRDDGTAGFHMSHGWSILCAVIGVSLLLELRAQAAKKENKRTKKH